ncbi:MAG: DinB family protein [Flavobacteriales bacterium]|jgi:hypothetical protein|nr:DinB family protein [Flavobacteriales bacterium]MBK6549193.1 DinB family protein [Flavobacteriales bacterium]MBK6884227.1 DinB family protein [Flavobacteriales bacterium]MBK7100608.1 DinB family protein [Flavobacteriales bacterium]MBK7111304.1 DinB family protein [Flavobacteriales bacterium]
MHRIGRPADPEVFPRFKRYIEHVEGDDLMASLDDALQRLVRSAEAVVQQHEEYRYALGKWSIKEVFQHLNDTERILAYRALRFSRNDATELPGFEEDEYVTHASTERRSLHDLVEEHRCIRQSTVLLFRSFSPGMLDRVGTASERAISVRALGWAIAGHALHHLHILEERYQRP